MVKSFSSDSRSHSVLRIDGSSHSCHLDYNLLAFRRYKASVMEARTLHCFALFFASRDAHRDHWFSPYLLMAALSTSSSTFDQEDVTTILDGLAGNMVGWRAWS